MHVRELNIFDPRRMVYKIVWNWFQTQNCPKAAFRVGFYRRFLLCILNGYLSVNRSMCFTFLHVCIGGKDHLLKNMEVKVCEILVMPLFVIYLTSHIYSSPEILAAGESFLKLSLSNDNSQTGVLNPDCQDLERKHKTRKKWPRCWSQKLAASLLLQTEMFLRLPVRQTNVFLSGTENKNITRLFLLYINLEPVLTEEVGFTTIYRVYKYCHHCPEEGLNQAVSPTLMLSKDCESSVL